MMSLDVRSIVFVEVITTLACFLVVILLWLQVRRRIPGTGFWVGDLALTATGLLLIVLRGHVPDWMSIVLANAAIIAGASLGYAGLETFAGRNRSLLFSAGFLAAYSAVHSYFTFIEPSLGARNINVAVGLLVVCARCSWLALRGAPAGIRQLMRGVGAVFGAYCAVSLARIAKYLISPASGEDYFSAGDFEALVMVANMMLLVLLTFSLALMFNNRFIAELEVERENVSRALRQSVAEIAERERAEAALEKERALYMDLMNTQPAGIFRIRLPADPGRDGTSPLGRSYSVEMLSDRFCQISGVERSFFETAPLGMHELAHPEDRPALVAKHAEALASLKGFSWEGRLRNKGAPAWVHLESIPRRLENGDIILTGILSDISERKQAEAEIRRLNTGLELTVAEQTRELRESQLALLNLVDDLNENKREIISANLALEAANKDLESFSYSVAHDLRAPLRAINGFTGILMEDYGASLDAEGQRVCAVIRENSIRMSRLIDDLLSFSRLGRAGIRFSSLDMEAIARSAFEELTSPEARARIDFSLGQLPPALGDPGLIREVWTNLLANAVKFSSKKERSEIAVSAETRDGEAVYSVRDNGAGFDMQYKDRLFGVFQRLHSLKEFEGTGVGLAIVQRIVSKHGGRVWAEGKPEGGAVFSFSLGTKGA
jgi:PAS domain S-box-containing protein